MFLNPKVGNLSVNVNFFQCLVRFVVSSQLESGLDLLNAKYVPPGLRELVSGSQGLCMCLLGSPRTEKVQSGLGLSSRAGRCWKEVESKD